MNSLSSTFVDSFSQMRGLLSELETANRKFSGSKSDATASSQPDQPPNGNDASHNNQSRSSRIPRRRTLNLSSGASAAPAPSKDGQRHQRSMSQSRSAAELQTSHAAAAAELQEAREKCQRLESELSAALSRSSAMESALRESREESARREEALRRSAAGAREAERRRRAELEGVAAGARSQVEEANKVSLRIALLFGNMQIRVLSNSNCRLARLSWSER